MDSPSGAVQPVADVPALATGNPAIDAMPIGRQIYWNPQLFEMTKNVATMLSGAKGFAPPHLIGNTETCFAVAALSLRTGLDPFFLAQGSYQTPGGQVGYMTRVTNALVESTGLLKKAPERIYSGPWENVEGKFQMVESQNQNGGGKKRMYAKRLWGQKEAKGCKLKLVFHWQDRDEPEAFEMDLSQVSTFNATTWATEPAPQFFRLVFRRAIDVLRPGLLAGVRHIDDLVDDETIDMKDVTPPKEGNAGLDEFAAAKPTETVVEPCAPDSQSEALDSEPTETQENGEEPTPVQDNEAKEPDSDGVTLWVNPDEPARNLTSLSNAQFVMKNEIRDAPTKALATAIMNQNMALITAIDNAAGNTDFSTAIEKQVAEKKDRKTKQADAPEDGKLV